MSVDVATLSVKIDSTDVNNATRAMDKATSSASGLEGIVKKVAAAWASLKVIEYAKQAATLAARYETLGAVMGVVGNNAGYTRAQMAGFEVELTKTGISMIGARDALTMMAGAQMDLTKSSQMARIAQDAAVIGNINSSEAFQRMVQGIRSGETEILRTIGISVNFEQAYQKMGKTLGKTSKDLTDLEKLMARQNIVMEYGSKIAGAYEASMGTAGKQLLSMARYAEDLQVVFGGIFSDAFGVVVQTLNGALAETKKWLTENAEKAELMRSNIGAAAQNFVGLVKDVMGTADGMQSIKDELSAAEILAGGLALTMAVIRDGVMLIVGVGQRFAANLLAIPQAVGEAVRYVMGLFNIAPPEWLQRVIGMRGDLMSKSDKNVSGGAIGAFYNGAPRDLFAEVDADNAKQSALEAEARRIKEGNQTRLNAEALAKKTQATEAAAKAEKKLAEVMRESNAATGALILQREIDAMWQGVESDRATKAAIEMQEYNRVMEESTDILKARAQAIEDAAAYQKSLQQDAARLSDPTGEAGQRLNDMFRGGLISEEIYQREMQKVRLEQLRLKAEAGNTWALIGDVVTQNAGHATDEMVRWMNNTDGLGRSWKSLGDTVRNVIADMLVQMQRAIIQQQLMQPLLNGLGKGISGIGSEGGFWANFLKGLSGKASGGTVYGGTSYIVGERGPELFTPGSTGFITPNHALGGGTTVSSQIIINVASDGSSSAKNNGTAIAQEMQRSVEPMVLQVIDKHMRPGGRLNPTRGGGMV